MEGSKVALEAMQEWVRETMHHSMRGLVRYSRDTGISISQIAALYRIHSARTRGVAQVGEDLGISSAAASQMLERLVQQGFVKRFEDPADRRSKRLSVTGKGMAIVQKGMFARQRWVESLARSLSGDEVELVAKALGLLVARSRAVDEAETGCGAGDGEEFA